MAHRCASTRRPASRYSDATPIQNLLLVRSTRTSVGHCPPLTRLFSELVAFHGENRVLLKRTSGNGSDTGFKPSDRLPVSVRRPADGAFWDCIITGSDFEGVAPTTSACRHPASAVAPRSAQPKVLSSHRPRSN